MRSVQIDITSAVLDYRKKTFLCIKFDTFPAYYVLSMELFFDRKRKAKVWDFFVFACCEILEDVINTIGVRIEQTHEAFFTVYGALSKISNRSECVMTLFSVTASYWLNATIFY